MRRSLILAVLIAIGVAAWIASGSLREGGARPEMQKEPARLLLEERIQQVRAETRRAEPRTVELRINGQTELVRQVQVRAEQSGPIAELPVSKGERVEPGEVIARIAELDREAGLRETRATMEQRRQEYEAARTLSERGHRAEIQLLAARAAFEVAQAAVRRAEIAVEQLSLRAPFAGTLEERLVELGDYVEVGNPVARIVDLDPILVVAQVNERDIGHLERGRPGLARLANGEELDGRLRYIARTADPATRTYRVELEVANPQHRIQDGMTAELRLPIAQESAHLVSPALLTLNDDGALGVNTIDEGRVRFRPVRIVEQNVEGVWIAGLPDEVTLITVGQEFVTDGQPVEAVDAAEINARRPELAQ